MAIWPFGRKSKKKTDANKRSTGPPPPKFSEGMVGDPTSEVSDVNSSTAGGNPRRKSSHRQSSRKLTKTPLAKMKDPEKVDTSPAILTSSQPTAKRQTGNIESTRTRQPSMPLHERGDVPSYYFQNPTSLTSLQPENFSVFALPPTLRAKKNPNDPAFPRRKSSKRKAEDQAREQEIKAMSSPIPIPKRPNSRTAGNIFRDSRKGLNSSTRNLERPLSDISLPIPESIHSTVSVVSDSHGFRVSALDALAPRPTIRYFENPRNREFGSGSLGPVRTSTKRERHNFTPEDGLKPNQRIANLADELDAGSIRELMDRDQRRSERSRRSDQEKLQRKLQRKADSQRAAEAASEGRVDGPSKENIDPTANGDEDMRLEGSTSPIAAAFDKSVFRDQGAATSKQWPIDSTRQDDVLGNVSNGRAGVVASDEQNEPMLETAKVVRLSQASMSPPFSPKQPFQGPSGLSLLAELESRSPPDVREQESDGRESDTSGRVSNNWTSIFRRSGIRGKESTVDRGQLIPLGFSNTSRESLTRPAPPSAFARVPPARSSTPIRTQSRFREDLPEHPLSPPDSRVQSPEASEQTPRQPLEPRNRDGPTSVMGSVISDQQLSEIHPAFRDQILQNRHQSLNYPSPEIPSSAILSQSLASVDSEGSWLTGRPMKRTSPTFATPLRGSASSLQRSRDLGASEDDDLGATGDEREESREVGERSRSDPAGKRAYLSSGSGGSGGIGGDSDGDSGDDIEAFDPEPPTIPPDEGKWHSAVGKHPTIVRQGRIAKSREGLLDDFQAGEDYSLESSPTGESPTGVPFDDQITPPESSLIYRATSVDLGKGHARHMSAGSARLLDLPPRTSAEMKRLSTASGERSPLGVGLGTEKEVKRD